MLPPFLLSGSDSTRLILLSSSVYRFGFDETEVNNPARASAEV